MTSSHPHTRKMILHCCPDDPLPEPPSKVGLAVRARALQVTNHDAYEVGNATDRAIAGKATFTLLFCELKCSVSSVGPLLSDLFQ